MQVRKDRKDLRVFMAFLPLSFDETHLEHYISIFISTDFYQSFLGLEVLLMEAANARYEILRNKPLMRLWDLAHIYTLDFSLRNGLMVFELYRQRLVQWGDTGMVTIPFGQIGIEQSPHRAVSAQLD